MKPSEIRGPHRMLPFWLAPCVCLALLLMFPSEAEPGTLSSTVRAVTVSEPRQPIAAPELVAPSPATVHVVLTRGHKRLEIDLPIDGKVSPEMANEIARIMRCPTSGRTRRIASGTLALLADVAARFPGHEIEVISAVRDEPERTRGGVKHSKHWSGHAIDIKVRGAKLADVRDAMWKNHRNIGVGWYPDSGFIHIDYRPDVHDTAWTQAKRNADNNYNPRWARLARAAQEATETAPAWRAPVDLLLESATIASLVPLLAEAIAYSQASIGRE
jgi:uncharacterized protein YcbK (DUF882 family)